MNIDIAFLDRRRFLRGSAVALALPWLESFVGASDVERRAQRKRFACVYWPDGVPMPLLEDPAYKGDSRALLQFRTIDIWDGNWDRHSKQWRWAKIPDREGLSMREAHR